MTNVYSTGEQPVITIRFTVAATGVLGDPDTVVVRVCDPTAVVTTPDVTRVEEGVYQAQVIPPMLPGYWQWEALGTGAVAGSVFGGWYVSPDPF